MNTIYQWTAKLREKVAKLNEKGQGMVEYAIILAAVAVIAAAVLYTPTSGTDNSLEKKISGAFENAGNKIDAAQKKDKTETETETE